MSSLPPSCVRLPLTWVYLHVHTYPQLSFGPPVCCIIRLTIVFWLHMFSTIFVLFRGGRLPAFLPHWARLIHQFHFRCTVFMKLYSCVSPPSPPLRVCGSRNPDLDSERW